MNTTAIIVDDEPTLIEHLQGKLKRLWPTLEIVGNAVNGRQAIALASETQPDIAFLDIHMPGLSGLQVTEALPDHTKVVFVTAYDNFAIEAFERSAIDYVLKPINDKRLEQTVKRLQENKQSEQRCLVSLLREIAPSQKEYLQWIRAGLDDTTQLVAADEIIYFQADQKYTTVMTAQGEYLVRRSIKDLEEQLNPDKFWRIHRGVIVRVDQIIQAKRDLRGRYTLTLRDSAAKLRSSQSYGHLFRQM